MRINKISTKVLLTLSLVFLFNVSFSYAHCDGVNGPVVKAAKKALETKNLSYVLIWISKEDETAVKEIYQKVEEVRNLNEEAKELADLYFFETVVRLHRKSEGESYTGLRFNEDGINPAILAADKALEKQNFKILSDFYKDESAIQTLHDKYDKVIKSKSYNINDVNKGRIFVRDYIDYIHTAVGLTGEGEIHETELHKSESQTNHNH